MKRNLIGLAGLTAILLAAPLATASAADMSLKAAPPPPPPPSWTGCYVDAGYGYGLSDTEQHGESFPGAVQATAGYSEGGRGWLGRFGGGCDYQFGLGGLGNWVIGAFADYDVMDIHGGFSPGDLSLAGSSKESDAWYAGGRIGYVVTPNLLTYFDGGYTETHFDQTNLGGLLLAGPAAADFIPSHTYNGWFIGGGTEYALNFSWLPIKGLFWRNEYRYASYSGTDLPVNVAATGLPLVTGDCSPTGAVATACGEHMKPYVQTITSSLVWRFNWLGR
jgi:outer membrane immunogenic protein